MSQKIVTTLTLFIFILALFLGLWLLTSYYAALPENLSQRETLLLGQNMLVSSAQTVLW